MIKDSVCGENMKSTSFQGNQKSDLEKQLERFSFALKGANDGLWDWDMETNEVYYSPRWKSMLGYEENELENNIETWGKLVHPEDKNKVREHVDAYINGHADFFEIEVRIAT